MSDERNRDFGGVPSRGPDQGAGDRRDAGADALLELARLIGQSDPFAPEGAKAGSARAGSGNPGSADARLANISRVAAAAARDPFPPPPPPPPQERSYEDRSRREADFGEPRVPVQSPQDADDGLDFLRLPERGDHSVAPRHAADERDYDRGGRRQQLPAAFGRDSHPDDYRGDGYADGEYGMEPDDDFDDDERGAKRGRSTKVIMAVLGLAVFGGAAAFGYRMVFNNGTPSGPTPVILADKSPTKMTPMSDAKPDSGRFGDRVGGEQLVRRDEDPVDVATYRSSGGDAAGQYPQDATGGLPGLPNIMPATPGAVAPPADTKRVHTVAITADSGTANRNRGQTAPAQNPPAQSLPASRQVAVTPQPSPPAPPPQRQAALAPAAADAVAPPVESGGYVVQLSAVRSEADAQTAFRQLQSKYPVLSGRQPLIRRKDQGEKGIFFAAQVGPFGAKGDADQLCDQLKSAGGSCYVLRN